MNNCVQIGHVPPTHPIVVIKYCNNPISCVVICNARIYYVIHKLPITIKAWIHFGSHNHHVSISDCHESIAITKELGRLHVEKNPRTTTLAIALATSMTLLNHKLFSFGESTITKLQGAHLHGLRDKFSTLFLPNIKNLVD